MNEAGALDPCARSPQGGDGEGITACTGMRLDGTDAINMAVSRRHRLAWIGMGLASSASIRSREGQTVHRSPFTVHRSPFTIKDGAELHLDRKCPIHPKRLNQRPATAGRTRLNRRPHRWQPVAPPRTSAHSPRCRRHGPPRRWAGRRPWTSGPRA